MAPLQKRALYGLIIGICLGVAILILLLLRGGVSGFDTDVGLRLVVDAIWIAGLAAPAILFWPITRNSLKFDERDRMIMIRSTRAQWVAVILSLAAWLVILSEAYHTQGAVPVTFLYFIFISILIISTLAQSVGIIVEYWKMGR